MLRVIKGRRFATRLQALAEDDRQICGSVLYFHKGSPDPAMLRADGPCSSIGPYCMEEMEGIVENLFNVIGPAEGMIITLRRSFPSKIMVGQLHHRLKTRVWQFGVVEEFGFTLTDKLERSKEDPFTPVLGKFLEKNE
jgi:hypothetical protein